MIFPTSPDALRVELDRLVESGNAFAFALRWRIARTDHGGGGGWGGGWGRGWGKP